MPLNFAEDLHFKLSLLIVPSVEWQCDGAVGVGRTFLERLITFYDGKKFLFAHSDLDFAFSNMYSK